MKHIAMKLKNEKHPIKNLIFLYLPGIEYNGRKKVDEEEVFAEDEDVRALPFRRQQYEDSGAHPLRHQKTQQKMELTK